VKAVGERDYKELSEMCSERLYVRIKECLVGMFADGYRMRLHNKWASNLEYSIFSYMEYEHLSPIVSHNLKLEGYNITQYNFFSFPYRLKCELKLNQKESSSIVPVETALSDRFRSPYYIRDLPRDDPYVFELYRKYPLTLLNIDVGFLSQLRIHIFDIYSQGKLAEGEKDPEEYEFHLLRMQKVFPLDPARHEKEPEYKQFIDINFDKEFHNWHITDCDKFIEASPFNQ
jgi:hypothetical protein